MRFSGEADATTSVEQEQATRECIGHRPCAHAGPPDGGRAELANKDAKTKTLRSIYLRSDPRRRLADLSRDRRSARAPFVGASIRDIDYRARAKNP